MKLSSPLMVQVDMEGGALSESSKSLLALARTLTDGDLVALTLEDTDVSDLATWGADRVIVARANGLSARVPAAVADALVAGVGVIGDDLEALLVTSSYIGRASAAMFAAKAQVGAAVDVASVSVENGGLVGRKSALAGTWTTTFATEGAAPVLAIRAGGTPIEPVTPGSATTAEVVEFELSRGASAVELVSSHQLPQGARVSLKDADIVVVAGRGVDGNVEMVEELADALGAGIGATRVACDEGWFPRSAQIGQTGESIAPKLYIGLGVSGAVHHTCGMLASEKIVVVVDDPDAPILEVADFAVVGDVNDVIPQALEALRAAGE